MAIAPGKLQTQSSAHALVIRPDTAPAKYLSRLLIYAVIALGQGMSGGNCAICIVPRPLSGLDPCEHVDFRTLKFLKELKEAQQTSRMKVAGKISSAHPAHTLRPILLIQPEQELKSGIARGFFRP